MPKDTRTLSTHVLDTSLGKAAVDVPLSVYRLLENQQWQELKQAATDKDGRASQLLETNDFKSGIYKLQFNVQKYYDNLGVACFYPFIEIVVKCVAGQHYHIPLLLSPFGYTTYRGT
ncbi:5-hydroxyisourate hydrolase isoform X2 [Lucilia sericata]|nr:5-hydroxyisourate hydrolase isoform X2 [Lucilia sericata]